MRRPESTPPEVRLDASERRGLCVLLGIVAVGGLITSCALNMAQDPRPVDLQLSSGAAARITLTRWEQQLSRGLRVSLRAVADGHDAPPAPQIATTATTSSLATPKPAPAQTSR